MKRLSIRSYRSGLFVLLGLCLVFGLVSMVMAQVTNAPPGPASPPLPQTVADYWDYVISAVTPIVIWLVAKFIPKVPNNLLPVLTPVVGIGLGATLNALGASHLSWVDMGKAGALAVFIRECVNQNVTQLLTAGSGKAPNAASPPAK